MSEKTSCLLSSPEAGTTVTASSVLQKNGKLYGANKALEDSDTSCWNSDQGESQSYVVKFGRLVKVEEIKLQFQAGFSCEIIRLFIKSDDCTAYQEVSDEELEPEDDLELQTFRLDKPVQCVDLRLEFEDFRDFYGRVTLYRIQVCGSE